MLLVQPIPQHCNAPSPALWDKVREALRAKEFMPPFSADWVSRVHNASRPSLKPEPLPKDWAVLLGRSPASWNITTTLRSLTVNPNHRGAYVEDIVRNDFWANHVHVLDGAHAKGEQRAPVH